MALYLVSLIIFSALFTGALVLYMSFSDVMGTEYPARDQAFSIFFRCCVVCLPIVYMLDRIDRPVQTVWFGEEDRNGKQTGFITIVAEYAQATVISRNGKPVFIHQVDQDEEMLNSKGSRGLVLEVEKIKNFSVSTYKEWFGTKNKSKWDIPVIIAHVTDGDVIKIAEHHGTGAEMSELYHALTDLIKNDAIKNDNKATLDDDDFI